jgi:hypothetical protein
MKNGALRTQLKPFVSLTSFKNCNRNMAFPTAVGLGFDT